MGHPGEDAMAPLVDQAEAAGIIVTSGNNPLPNIEAKYKAKGFGYAGADLYAGGLLTGRWLTVGSSRLAARPSYGTSSTRKAEAKAPRVFLTRWRKLSARATLKSST
jgi:hypothetical protein